MKKILICLCFGTFSIGLEKSSKHLDIPGSLRPTQGDCSPLGDLKLALKDNSIHGSRDTDLQLALNKQAQAYYYEVRDQHIKKTKQTDMLNEKFKTTTSQINYLKEAKKKLRPEQQEEIAQCEISLLVHKMDACSLHMAMIMVQSASVFDS